MTAHLSSLIPNAIPNDHCEQSSALSMLGEAKDRFELGELSAPDVLDLGCGAGKTFEALRKVVPKLNYFGVDIEDSPEVRNRRRTDLSFDTYDGVNLPYDNASMDIVFSSQVLEHVRHPDLLLRDLVRVLRDGGVFVGSVSFLEPYHSLSIFNWSPYGVVKILEEHGFRNVTLRPGIDGIALTLRTIFGKNHFRGSWAKDSLFNYFIGSLIENKDRTPAQINAQKLAVAGHICFYASK